MKSQPHPLAVRSFAGNSEERAAQIARITERINRIGGNAHEVAAELAVLAREISALHDSGAPLPKPNGAKSSH